MTGATARHGTIGRFARGCRCLPCRLANTERVRRQREGTTIGLVDAAPARAHLLALKAAGVGAWRAAELAGLSKTLVGGIRSGRIPQVRPETAAKLLAVPMKPALGTRISAAETMRRLRTLLAEQYTKRELARQLGYPARLPFRQKGDGTRVTLRSALRVRRLYRALEGPAPAPGADPGPGVDGDDEDDHPAAAFA